MIAAIQSPKEHFIMSAQKGSKAFTFVKIVGLSLAVLVYFCFSVVGLTLVQYPNPYAVAHGYLILGVLAGVLIYCAFAYLKRSIKW